MAVALLEADPASGSPKAAKAWEGPERRAASRAGKAAPTSLSSPSQAPPPTPPLLPLSGRPELTLDATGRGGQGQREGERSGGHGPEGTGPMQAARTEAVGTRGKT